MSAKLRFDALAVRLRNADARTVALATHRRRGGAATSEHVAGTLYDTGLGYPALVAGGDRGVPGWLLGLSERAPTVLERLDVVEGPHYRRTDVTTLDGVRALTYAYVGDPAGFTVLDGPWDRDDER
jgi:gamma-glutamylcyclotransferase (GGCT)/AIG2-like uncharacterized protein YtfP